MRRLALATIIAAVILPSAALAQTSNGGSAAASKSTPPLDPNKLGISVGRIQRELRERQFDSGADPNGLRLNYRIEVYGQAPSIDVIGDFDIFNGPVPGSGPTHRDMIEQVTPQEYRAPAASLSNVFFWAAQKLTERNSKQRCEAELEQYKAQVMAGMNVAPPSCAQ